MSSSLATAILTFVATASCTTGSSAIGLTVVVYRSVFSIMLRIHTVSPAKGSSNEATTMSTIAVTARPRPGFFVSTVVAVSAVVAVSSVALIASPVSCRPEGSWASRWRSTRHHCRRAASEHGFGAQAGGDVPSPRRYGSAMLIAGTDGSEASIAALRTGLAVVAPDDILLVTVVDHGDESRVSGTGMAGGVMTDTEFDAMEKARLGEAESSLAEAAEALGLGSAETQVLRGDPARALCDLASDRDARAIVVRTRARGGVKAGRVAGGRGGVKRAVLGSVSEHVVRNAPCPVLITRPPD